MSNVIMAQEKYEYRYWFDTSDKSALTGTSDSNGFHIEIDTSPLATGLHSFNYQIINAEAGESTVKTAFFYKIPSFQNKKSMVLVDGRPYGEYSISEKEPSVVWIDMDADTLSVGLHTLAVQLIDDSGVASAPVQAFFMKVPSTGDFESMSFYYVVDSVQSGRSECQFVDGVACAELDMSSLSDGLHSITFFMGNDNGFTTQAETAFFTKESLGGEDTGVVRIAIDGMRNGKAYDLQGRRVSGTTSPGLYIIDSKKTIVR